MSGKFSKDVMKASLRRFSSGEFQKIYHWDSLEVTSSYISLIRQLALEGFLKEATWQNGMFAITHNPTEGKEVSGRIKKTCKGGGKFFWHDICKPNVA